MFFENDNFSAEKISSLHLNRAAGAGNSGTRVHYALSYRVVGNSIFRENIRDTKKVFEAKSDSIILVPPSASYRLENEQEELFVIHFMCEDRIADEIKLFYVYDKEKVKTLFCDIHTAFIQKQPGYKHKVKYLFYKLVYTLEAEYAHMGSSLTNKYITSALSYINEHMCEPGFTALSVSDHLNISPVYLRKLFSSAFACSPKSYIDRAKTERALTLLGSGEYTVSEVSEMCGFSDTYYFSSFIKKHTGNSPKHHLD
ncbi:MAG: helix-turn-helix transcriptional regulator [Clostridia bacterium]|nr:helix-turn-helix transcriptional regulator [Clostridia bacterium]